jgi:hypothetical protein
MHRLVRQSILLVVLLAAACASAQPPLRDDPWMIVTNPQDCLITWTPTTKQVLAARDAARLALRRVAKRNRDRRATDARDILQRWHGYRLQACGLTENHRRIIYLNFITPESPADAQWKRNELVDVSDGGFYFWQAKYDPATGMIISWQANGLG